MTRPAMETPRYRGYRPGMGRTLRPHLPGAPFHLTARIQGREPLLAGVEEAVHLAMLRCAGPADVRLLAYAVMPNHLHMVAVQGQHPLSWFMHPLLRRVALMVRRVHGGSGHVFERRFFSAACLDADYLRNALAYVHLNPMRAGLCGEPGDSRCTSHNHYVTDASDGVVFPGAAEGLALFAPYPNAEAGACRTSYAAFIAWRIDADNRAAGGLPPSMAQPPVFRGGDVAWAALYGASSATGAAGAAISGRRQELSEIAQCAINQLAPGLQLDLLRLGDRTRTAVAVRNTIIDRALAVGHEPSTISRYLRVSSTTISRVAVRQRLGRSGFGQPDPPLPD